MVYFEISIHCLAVVAVFHFGIALGRRRERDRAAIERIDKLMTEFNAMLEESKKQNSVSYTRGIDDAAKPCFPQRI